MEIILAESAIQPRQFSRVNFRILGSRWWRWI
jgi:hypothetical protein